MWAITQVWSIFTIVSLLYLDTYIEYHAASISNNPRSSGSSGSSALDHLCFFMGSVTSKLGSATTHAVTCSAHCLCDNNKGTVTTASFDLTPQVLHRWHSFSNRRPHKQNHRSPHSWLGTRGLVNTSCANLQANVSATIRLFGGDSSHTPFFDWQPFQDNTLYPLAIIHMEHINVLDFDDKSERNLCFSFGNSGIIFNGASAQLFPPREKW